MRRALLLTVTSVSLAVTACESSPELGPFDLTTQCRFSGPSPNVMDLAPIGIEALDLRVDGRAILSWGDPCGGATDEPAKTSCLAAFAELPAEPSLVIRVIDHWDAVTEERMDVVVTRGDEAARVTTKEELIAVLGRIDTLDEATLVAMANGHFSNYCKTNDARREGDAFVLYLTSVGGCNSDLVEYELRVDATGAVKAGEPNVLESYDCDDL